MALIKTYSKFDANWSTFWTQIIITFVENSFRTQIVNRGPEVCLGARLSSERLDLSNAFEEGKLSLILFSLPPSGPIAHAFHTDKICSASFIDRPQS